MHRRLSGTRGSEVSDQQRLSGHVALVTGASQGIGRAIALKLARDGADVCVNYLQHDSEAEALANQIEGLGSRAIAIAADVSEPKQIASMIAEAAANLGPVDILVNNAAIFPWKLWSEISVEEWDRTFAVNARGPWLMARAVAPAMVARGWGRIVSIASATFLTGSSHLAHYSASKGAVVGLTRSLALALGKDGITVNAVSTGKTLTEGFNKFFEDGALDYEETVGSRKGQAIERLGAPEDVTGAIAFLASDDASYLTGQLINVDGGRNMY